MITTIDSSIETGAYTISTGAEYSYPEVNINDSTRLKDGKPKRLAYSMLLPSSSHLWISSEDLKIYENKIIGQGQFGKVFQAEVNGEKLAAKTLKDSAVADFCDEVLAGVSVGFHENVLIIVGIHSAKIKDTNEFLDVILTPLMDCGNLHEYLKTAPDQKVSDLISFSLQTAKGLKHLHAKRLIHGDLATRNVLLNSSGVIKVCDFGKSEDAYEYAYKGNVQQYAFKSKQDFDQTALNPWRWLPPELYMCGQLDTYSDIWAYGVTIWEMFTKSKLPYQGMKNFQLWVLQNNRLVLPIDCPMAVYFLMIRCWHVSKKRRPKLSDIIFSLENFTLNRHKFGIDFGQRVSGKFSRFNHTEIRFEVKSISNQDTGKKVDGDLVKNLPYAEATFIDYVEIDEALVVKMFDVESKLLKQMQSMINRKTVRRSQETILDNAIYE